MSEREKLYTEHRAYKLVTNNRVRTNTCLSRFCEFLSFCSSFSTSICPPQVCCSHTPFAKVTQQWRHRRWATYAPTLKKSGRCAFLSFSFFLFLFLSLFSSALMAFDWRKNLLFLSPLSHDDGAYNNRLSRSTTTNNSTATDRNSALYTTKRTPCWTLNTPPPARGSLKAPNP